MMTNLLAIAAGLVKPPAIPAAAHVVVVRPMDGPAHSKTQKEDTCAPCLSDTQESVMRWLEVQSSPKSARQIFWATGLPKSSCSKVLNALRRMDLIARMQGGSGEYIYGVPAVLKAWRELQPSVSRVLRSGRVVDQPEQGRCVGGVGGDSADAKKSGEIGNPYRSRSNEGKNE